MRGDEFVLPRSLNVVRVGRSSPARIAMIAMTTNSSISVKARNREAGQGEGELFIPQDCDLGRTEYK